MKVYSLEEVKDELNYKELDKKFTGLLKSYSKEDLEAWVAFDKQRTESEALKKSQLDKDSAQQT